MRSVTAGGVGLGVGTLVVLGVGTGGVGFVAALIAGWTVEAWLNESVLFPFLGVEPMRNPEPYP